jgi:cytochrome c oxidase subunit 2
MSMLLLVFIILMVFVVIFQVAKASEYVSVLRGEKRTRQQNNRINGFMMIAFLVLGLTGVWYCNHLLYDKTLLAQPSASNHGVNIDRMLWMTLTVTGVVFIGTQVLLFWFAFRYQEKEGEKPFYFPHNNKLEILWTTVPAIFLTGLVAFGIYYWFKATGEAPKDAMVVEVTGKQFNWMFRYPGKDGELGKKDYKLVNYGKNDLGLKWDDKNSLDDITPSELHLVVGKPVKLVINAHDVIHDVGLPHFRMKMDAVPGIPTTMWFTPTITTKQMKEITKNPNFVYEISCDQMCGQGHWSMRGVIVVETQEEFDAWMANQKPAYYLAFPEKEPKSPSADSTSNKTAAATAAQPKVLASKN